MSIGRWSTVDEIHLFWSELCAWNLTYVMLLARLRSCSIVSYIFPKRNVFPAQRYSWIKVFKKRGPFSLNVLNSGAPSIALYFLVSRTPLIVKSDYYNFRLKEIPSKCKAYIIKSIKTYKYTEEGFHGIYVINNVTNIHIYTHNISHFYINFIIWLQLISLFYGQDLYTIS